MDMISRFTMIGFALGEKPATIEQLFTQVSAMGYLSLTYSRIWTSIGYPIYRMLSEIKNVSLREIADLIKGNEVSFDDLMIL